MPKMTEPQTKHKVLDPLSKSCFPNTHINFSFSAQNLNKIRTVPNTRIDSRTELRNLIHTWASSFLNNELESGLLATTQTQIPKLALSICYCCISFGLFHFTHFNWLL